MDYKEKYEQALERAKVINPKTADYEVAVKIFPELIESEDEKTRRKLIKALKECGFTHFNEEFTVQEAIAWLEKQGPQSLPIINERVLLSLVSDVLTWKDGIGQYLDDPRVQVLVKRLCDKYASSLYDVPNSSQSSNGENKQELTDNIESKFKVGDWITKDGATWQVLIANNNYILLGQNGSTIKEKVSIIDSEFRRWTIQDAKYGDVLVVGSKFGEGIAICGKDDTMGNNVLCCVYDDRNGFIINVKISKEYLSHPTTKEQRDLLFQKMKEAGYEWSDKDRKLIKITQ